MVISWPIKVTSPVRSPSSKNDGMASTYLKWWFGGPAWSGLRLAVSVSADELHRPDKLEQDEVE